jgi:hypothetical protein
VQLGNNKVKEVTNVGFLQIFQLVMPVVIVGQQRKGSDKTDWSHLLTSTHNTRKYSGLIRHSIILIVY